jgi:fibronectin type 3 domain-containing protein
MTRRIDIARCRIIAAVLCILTAAAIPLAAQPGLVHTGPDGVYVALGTSVLPGEVDGVRYDAYRVERRESDGEWAEIARVQGPATQLDLAQGLGLLRQRYPEFGDLRIDATEFWRRLQGSRQLRDIGMITRLLPVQLLLGVRFLDTTVQRARAYEYRISRIAADGSEGDRFTTPSIIFPGLPEVTRLRVSATEGETVAARVLWRAGAGTPPSSFRVFRREGLSGAYRELIPNSGDSCCNVTMTMIGRADTLLCSVLDKTVEAGLVYQYYAMAVDYFRNEGPPSDTATVITFQMRQVPLPERLKAYSVDTAGIGIRWELREPSAVHGIVIERGPALDSGFVELFTAGPADTSFLDMTVRPMERYYYRLRLIGPGGLRSVASAVVIGIFKSSVVPTPPVGVYATGIPGGVHLRWRPDSTRFLQGYYVYRGEGYGVPLRQQSAMLPAAAGEYVDTSASLLGGRTYMYAVQAVSSSHVAGAMSDTVGAMPQLPISVDIPVGVEAARDGNRVLLTWNTGQPRHRDVLGYRVYRMLEKDKRWLPVADTLQNPRQNFYTDSALQAGARAMYAVRAFSVTGDSSAMSAPAVVSIPARVFFPPGNLRAKREGKKVLLMWDEIIQQAAALHLYRYQRGDAPKLIRKLKPTDVEYVDAKPGRGRRVSYYLVTVGTGDEESRRSEIVTVPLR